MSLISHCTAVALLEKNTLNINMAVGLKVFLKRHFDAIIFSKVNNHKNSPRPKCLQLIVSKFICILVHAYITDYISYSFPVLPQ